MVFIAVHTSLRICTCYLDGITSACGEYLLTSRSITFGMLGPLSYNLSLRDSSLVILFFCMLSTVPPAFLAILGPKTGMRQMIQARYSFG